MRTWAGNVGPSSSSIPRSRTCACSCDIMPATRAWYVLSTWWRGCSKLLPSSPSVEKSRRPVVSISRRPTGKSPGKRSVGTRLATQGRPWGSDMVVKYPAGLLSMMATDESNRRTTTPSTSTTSHSGFTLLPSSVTTSPFTRTRPAVMRFSLPRRLAAPARARNFCRRMGTMASPFGPNWMGLGSLIG